MAETTVRMPKLSMTMEEGDLVAWEVSEGSTVKAGDILGQVITDKTEMDIEAPADGTVVRLIAVVGETLEVGAPLMVLSTDVEDLLDGLIGEPAAPRSVGAAANPPVSTNDEAVPRPVGADLLSGSEQDGVAAEGVAPTAVTGSPATVAPPLPTRSVPAARALARSIGVDIAAVTSTRADRVVTVEDVLRAGRPPAEAAAAGPAGIQPAVPAAANGKAAALTRATAAKMTASADVPQFVLYRALVLDHAERHRSGVSWTALLAYAAVGALRQNMRLNGTWTGSGISIPEQIVLGMAVDTEDGLVVCSVPDAGGLSLGSFEEALGAAVDRARRGAMSAEDRTPPTFTISNLGSLGVDWFQALVTPPQAAVLALGRVRRAVEATEDGLRLRRECQVGLTVDHRVANGADGARFLQSMSDLLGPAGFTDLVIGARRSR